MFSIESKVNLFFGIVSVLLEVRYGFILISMRWGLSSVIWGYMSCKLLRTSGFSPALSFSIWVIESLCKLISGE